MTRKWRYALIAAAAVVVVAGGVVGLRLALDPGGPGGFHDYGVHQVFKEHEAQLRAIPGITALGTNEYSNAPSRIVVYVDQVTPAILAAVPDKIHGYVVEIQEPLPVAPAFDGVVKAIAPATAAQAAAGLAGTLTVKGNLRQEDHGSVTSSPGTLIVNVPSRLKIWRPMGEGKEFIGFGDIRTGDYCRVVLEAAPSGRGRAVTAADLAVYDRI
jgi:hypothetical protein